MIYILKIYRIVIVFINIIINMINIKVKKSHEAYKMCKISHFY